MTAVTANRLSQIRKDRKLSQKEAAYMLGISQALLSHYENGVRECGLSFLINASKLYSVTTDWLLGLSDDRHGSFELSDFDSSKPLSLKGIIDAIGVLATSVTDASEFASSDVRSILTLCAYQLAIYSTLYGVTDESRFGLPVEESNTLAGELVRFIVRQSSDVSADYNSQSNPAAEMIIDEAEKIIRQQYSEILGL